MLGHKMTKRDRLTITFVLTVLAFMPQANAADSPGGWEATYDTSVSQPLQQLSSNKLESKPFSQMIVEYPANEGVDLGQSWDMFLNKKVMSTCVDFKAVSEKKYETAKVGLNEATDEETRGVTLNMTFTVSEEGPMLGMVGKETRPQPKIRFRIFTVRTFF
jgi:hypothetical protein